MPIKHKLNQPETPNKTQVRDNFQTPNYAIDLLVPFIPERVVKIWDACAGENGYGKIVKRLNYHNKVAFGTDIRGTEHVYNFINDSMFDLNDLRIDCSIMNVPYSLKRKFFERLMEYSQEYIDFCWAILIPADYSSWIIDTLRKGCEKIIPTRRISYIPPNILETIPKKELFLQKLRHDFSNLKSYTQIEQWEWYFDHYNWHDKYRYDSIYDIPSELIYKHSQSQFHSMWLTYGFGLGKWETFVDLSIDTMKINI